nr:hypothetical protein [Cressdnaviricota sp.]
MKNIFFFVSLALPSLKGAGSGREGHVHGVNTRFGQQKRWYLVVFLFLISHQ